MTTQTDGKKGKSKYDVVISTQFTEHLRSPLCVRIHTKCVFGNGKCEQKGVYNLVGPLRFAIAMK